MAEIPITIANTRFVIAVQESQPTISVNDRTGVVLITAKGGLPGPRGLQGIAGPAGPAGGLSSPDEVALAMYSLGQAVIVVGPKIAESEPPQRASITQEKVDHLISIGIPSDYILWNVVGEVTENIVLSADNSIAVVTFTEPLVTLIGEALLAPDVIVLSVLTEPLLSQVSNGTFTAEGLVVLVAVDAPAISQVPNGVLVLDNLTVTTLLDAPSISQITNGILAAENIESSATIDAPSLHDTNAVIMSTEAMESTSTLTEPTITCVGGVIIAEDMGIEVVATEPNISQLSNGELAGIATGITTTYAEPTITQGSNGVLASEPIGTTSSITEPTVTQTSNGSMTAEVMVVASLGTEPSITQMSNGTIAAENVTSTVTMNEPNIVSVLLVSDNMTASADMTAPGITQVSNGSLVASDMVSDAVMSEPGVSTINASPVFTQQPTFTSATASAITFSYGTSDAEGDHYKRETSFNGGATYYQGTVEDETPGSGKSITVSGLSAGTSYGMRVKLTPLTGDTTPIQSNSISMWTVPAAPSLSVTAGNTQNTLTMSATGATSYNVYYTSDGSTPTLASTQIAGVSSPYIHGSLTNDVTYKYIVTAVNAGGESAISNVLSGTPSAYPAVLTNGTVVSTAPFGLTALVASSGSLQQTAVDTFVINDVTTFAQFASLYNTTAWSGTYTHKIKLSGLVAAVSTNLWMVVKDAAGGVPAIGNNAAMLANRKFRFGIAEDGGANQGKVYIAYLATNGTTENFLQSNGTWSTSLVFIAPTGGGMQLQIQRDATNYTLTVLNADGSAITGAVGVVPIASVYHGSNDDYWMLGDNSTEAYGAATLQIIS